MPPWSTYLCDEALLVGCLQGIHHVVGQVPTSFHSAARLAGEGTPELTAIVDEPEVGLYADLAVPPAFMESAFKWRSGKEKPRAWCAQI